MHKVLILVEGQTEERFVKQVLGPYLSEWGVLVVPTIVKTKRTTNSAPDFKGGAVSYGKVKNDIQRLLKDSSAVAVTTMIDFYGLPSDFPGYGTMPTQTDCYARVVHLEHALAQDIAHPKFFPYLQLHEFEAMLFVAPAKIAGHFSEPHKLGGLLQIKAGFNNAPEEIDDGPETAPSKRLVKIFSRYQKTLHGPLITASIGLEEIQEQCKHFRGWLERLESLGKKGPR
jgi:hypothetical protein